MSYVGPFIFYIVPMAESRKINIIMKKMKFDHLLMF